MYEGNPRRAGPDRRPSASRACKEPDMSFFSSKRSASSTPDPSGRGSRLGPQRLAEFATRRPGRVLAVWGVVVLVSLGLTGTLLGSGLTSDSSLTNHPESAAAQELIDARLPGQSAVDEVIVVRSERLRGLRSGLRRACACLDRAGPSERRRQPDLQLPGPGRQDPGLRGPARHRVARRRRPSAGGADRGPHLARRAQRRQRRVRRAHHRQPTRSTATSRSSRRAT